MSLEELLYLIRQRRDILVSESEIWWSSHGPDRRMSQALRRHKRGVRLLIHWSDSAACPARLLHAPTFYYRHGRFICGACEQLLREVC